MYTRQGCRKRNIRRIYFADYQNQENNKVKRKLLRGKRKGKNDKMEEKGVTYATGNF